MGWISVDDAQKRAYTSLCGTGGEHESGGEDLNDDPIDKNQYFPILISVVDRERNCTKLFFFLNSLFFTSEPI